MRRSGNKRRTRNVIVVVWFDDGERADRVINTAGTKALSARPLRDRAVSLSDNRIGASVSFGYLGSLLRRGSHLAVVNIGSAVAFGKSRYSGHLIPRREVHSGIERVSRLSEILLGVPVSDVITPGYEILALDTQVRRESPAAGRARPRYEIETQISFGCSTRFSGSGGPESVYNRKINFRVSPSKRGTRVIRSTKWQEGRRRVPSGQQKVPFRCHGHSNTRRIKPAGNQTFQYPCSCRIYAIKRPLATDLFPTARSFSSLSLFTLPSLSFSF